MSAVRVTLLLLAGLVVGAAALLLVQKTVLVSDKADAGRAEVQPPSTALLRVKSPRAVSEETTSPLYLHSPPSAGPAGAAAGGVDASDAAWQREVANHVNLLKSDAVCMQLIADANSKVRLTKWYASFQGDRPAEQALESLRKALVVRQVPGTSLVAVHVDVRPPSEAVIIANELCENYINLNKVFLRGRAEKRIELLQREYESVMLELNQDVIRLLRDKEKILGGDQVGTFFAWNGKQRELEQLMDVRLRLTSDLAAAVADRKALAEAEGSDPTADLQRAAEQSLDVQRLRAELAQVQLSLAELAGGGAAAAATTTRPASADTAQRRDALTRRAAACERMLADAVTRAVGAARAERIQSLDQRIREASAKGTSVDSRTLQLAQDLGRLNEAMNEYRILQTREQDLRRTAKELGDRIRTAKEFELSYGASEVEFAGRPIAIERLP